MFSQVQDMIYEGLVQYGPGGKLEPALAESWDVSTSGPSPSITFQLRTCV